MIERTTSIPESLLSKLFDETGTNDGSGKGFFLFYTNNEGEPMFTARFENTSVRLALEKMTEMVVDNGFDMGEPLGEIED